MIRLLEAEKIICSSCESSQALTVTDLYLKNLETLTCDKCGNVKKLVTKSTNIIVYIFLILSNAILLFYSWKIKSLSILGTAILIDIFLPILVLKISIKLKKDQ
ncbi:MAG: hypothetical protein COW01_02230 [Bdellovibrionales bacterium CG12_big_fil_rev_8_21_14_0_65_38_15]|nr:MAG: hypothetical protein COW79_02465 [Bdellovibrionales bacterium CG22_combo_CG10-13_8_21_14_all_38_13]PIQ57124.1 MAG: hypothetical protein COW01_02230 [Bdellovibrionales bacterium CG12_big_fil_rev_8_21_14_0_65_38_15]PIR30154.1 MAG: hypothetical protein COV38_07625 [Bdellovibrionales bacterium CG11_big_fil_rev_8_21_14_0_20_38_13]